MVDDADDDDAIAVNTDGRASCVENLNAVTRRRCMRSISCQLQKLSE